MEYLNGGFLSLNEGFHIYMKDNLNEGVPLNGDF